MPPQQIPEIPNVGPRPSGHNPYEFIMNPEQPKRPSPFKFSGSPMKILALVGGAAVVLIALIIIVSLLSSSSPVSKTYVSIAQQQTEIARVAGLQASSLTTASAQNFATTTQLSMQSDSATLTGYLHKHGIKISAKQLAAGAHSTIDTKLQNAQNNNELDATLVAELQSELTAYQRSLQQAYQQTSTASSRSMLTSLNKNATLLLDESKQ